MPYFSLSCVLRTGFFFAVYLFFVFFLDNSDN